MFRHYFGQAVPIAVATTATNPASLFVSLADLFVLLHASLYVQRLANQLAHHHASQYAPLHVMSHALRSVLLS